MATITVTPAQTFITGDTVIPATLNALGQPAVALTAGTIVDADISASAAIGASKLAATLDLSTKTLTLPDGNVATAKVADAAITAPKLSGAQTGSAPIYGARAWVNFSGTTSDNLAGTYAQSGTTVTVTATAHGHKVGHIVAVTVATGTGVTGTYTVATVPTANTFTYTAGTSLTTSGNITLTRRQIRASGNVANVAFVQTGEYAVNFTTDLPDGNYATSIASDPATGSGGIPIQGLSGTQTASSFYIRTTTTGALANAAVVHAVAFR